MGMILRAGVKGVCMCEVWVEVNDKLINLKWRVVFGIERRFTALRVPSLVVCV